jgi:hypothetical protein
MRTTNDPRMAEVPLNRVRATDDMDLKRLRVVEEALIESIADVIVRESGSLTIRGVEEFAKKKQRAFAFGAGCTTATVRRAAHRLHDFLVDWVNTGAATPDTKALQPLDLAQVERAIQNAPREHREAMLAVLRLCGANGRVSIDVVSNFARDAALPVEESVAASRLTRLMRSLELQRLAAEVQPGAKQRFAGHFGR